MFPFLKDVALSAMDRSLYRKGDGTWLIDSSRLSERSSELLSTNIIDEVYW